MSTFKPTKGVFLALTFEDAIYSNYPNVSKEIQERKFQNLLITLREDGYFGFIGGTVDEGETELEALTRECLEEGNIALEEFSELVRVSEHFLPDGFAIILYHASISKNYAQRIIIESALAEHFFTETAGIVSVACHEKSSFYKNAFLSVVKSQIGEIGLLLNDPIMIKWGNS